MSATANIIIIIFHHYHHHYQPYHHQHPHHHHHEKGIAGGRANIQEKVRGGQKMDEIGRKYLFCLSASAPDVITIDRKIMGLEGFPVSRIHFNIIVGPSLGKCFVTS